MRREPNEEEKVWIAEREEAKRKVRELREIIMGANRPKRTPEEYAPLTAELKRHFDREEELRQLINNSMGIKMKRSGNSFPAKEPYDALEYGKLFDAIIDDLDDAMSGEWDRRDMISQAIGKIEHLVIWHIWRHKADLHGWVPEDNG